MNRRKLALSGTAIACVGVAWAVLAQPAPVPAGSDHAAMMARTITRDEAKAGAERLFTAMDLDKDGKLDAADREVEFGRMFDRIDADRDGTISRAEFLAAHRGAMGHEHAGPGQGGPGQGGPGQGGMRMRAMGMGMHIVRAADPQHTGTVTRDAFIAAALAMFDKSDANRDGKLTPEERRAGMAMHRMGGGGMHGGKMGGMQGADDGE